MFTDQVECLLRDEPAELTKIYVFLQKHMDAKSLITGIKRRVSHQAVKELLEVPATKGRCSVPVDRRKARAYLKRMVTIGLVEDHGHCVFKLIHESLNDSASMRLAQAGRKASTQNSNQNNTLDNSLAQAGREVGTPLSTATTTKLAFEMYREWQPSPEFEQDALRAGYDIKDKQRGLYEEALNDLIYAYLGKEELIGTRRNQIGWQHALLKSMKYLLNQHIAEMKKIESGATAAASPSNGAVSDYSKRKSPKVSMLIANVPSNDNDLRAYHLRYAEMGAPSAPSASSGRGYHEWRTSLKRWRNETLRQKQQEATTEEPEQLTAEEIAAIKGAL